MKNKPSRIFSYKTRNLTVICLPLRLLKLENSHKKCNETRLCCTFGNLTSSVLMTSQLVGKNCDGGHYTCSPPKECCKQGCCYLLAPSVYRPPTLPAGNMFNPLFLGHWYFWLAVTGTIAGILCVCSMWRRHSQGNFCCRNGNRDERASEPDSNGSCYAPPQYSRCSSFHQAPPPYSEVTSKPDLYPLVINYNGDSGVKSNGGSTGYLMVQYFRNFIVRPVGSLSATSTIDSLSSSFICNATNEANTIIPPPYSCMGSLEEVSPGNNNNVTAMDQFPRSVSSVTCNDYQMTQNSPSVHSHLSGMTMATSQNHMSDSSPNNTQAAHLRENEQYTLLIRNNPCYLQDTTNYVNNVTVLPNVVDDAVVNKRVDIQSNAEKNINTKSQCNCDASPSNTMQKVNRKLNINILPNERSVDSESQEEEHNFSDLLNLSVCVPHLPLDNSCGIQSNPNLQEMQQSYSVTNSMTSSDISSLANLGTPDSPPRATSPTVEMRELLDKIQQLPQQKSPVPGIPNQQEQKSKSYFHRNKAKTLYMPLYEGPISHKSKISPNGKISGSLFGRGTKSWLSRSAPNTPCGNFAPSFPTYKKNSGSQKGSKVKVCDGSPLLLNEHEESDEEAVQKDECL